MEHKFIRALALSDAHRTIEIWEILFLLSVKVFSLLIEWCGQAVAGLDNMGVNSRIFLHLSLLCLFRGVLVGFGVGFSVSWFPVQFGYIN